MKPRPPESGIEPMDDALYFAEQHLAVREMVRQFARDEVARWPRKLDADATFPWDNIRKMGELGLLGVPWSEELGGAGLDTISFMIAIDELAKVDASHGLTISAHTTLGTSPIVKFGNDAQRERYVPLLASGKVWAASASPSRTPAAMPEERARPPSEGQLLCPQRHEALHHARRRRRDLRRHRRHRSRRRAPRASARSSSPSRRRTQKAPSAGIGHDRRSSRCPAFARGRRRTSSAGARRTPCELIMEDVEVPAENLLGGRGRGS